MVAFSNVTIYLCHRISITNRLGIERDREKCIVIVRNWIIVITYRMMFLSALRAICCGNRWQYAQEIDAWLVRLFTRVYMLYVFFFSPKAHLKNNHIECGLRSTFYDDNIQPHEVCWTKRKWQRRFLTNSSGEVIPPKEKTDRNMIFDIWSTVEC